MIINKKKALKTLY